MTRVDTSDPRWHIIGFEGRSVVWARELEPLEEALGRLDALRRTVASLPLREEQRSAVEASIGHVEHGLRRWPIETRTKGPR
jgi:hypothetical protein